MRFYNRQHRHYCGIDHAKTMYVCILDATGQMLVHRGYAAFSVGTTQPGNTSTPGWHFKARARALARSTPKRTRSFSMAEIVACERPVRFASSFWLNPCSSRMIRTDSRAVTVARFRSTRYALISWPPIVVRRHRLDVVREVSGVDAMDHSPLVAQPARPRAGRTFVGHFKKGRPCRSVFFLLTVESGYRGQPAVRGRFEPRVRRSWSRWCTS